MKIVMETVYTTPERSEAVMVQLLLDREGLETRMVNEGGALHAIGIPTTTAPFEILVQKDQLEKAHNIIDEYLEDQEEYRKRIKKELQNKDQLAPEEKEFREMVEESNEFERLSYLSILLTSGIAMLIGGIFGSWIPLVYLGVIVIPVVIIIWTVRAGRSDSS